ncbi:uncharacterized protein METZ01_LOCUS55908 [marine metagenome]|uniref:Uncharacterized protein n=1 Tax=marine metagenome TaxID=408172 RepID=A0A381SHW0_9ZZZZ
MVCPYERDPIELKFQLLTDAHSRSLQLLNPDSLRDCVLVATQPTGRPDLVTPVTSF